MGWVYQALNDDARTLREICSQVTTVVFYDFDFPDEEELGRWESAAFLGADGNTVLTLTPRDERWQEYELTELADSYGDTVKFWLKVSASEP